MASGTVCGVFSNGMSVGYGGAWEAQWLSVSLMIVLVVIAISSLLYALSGVMPTRRREKLKNIVHYELFEAFVSIILIFVILALSDLACYAGSALFGASNYQGLFSNDELYIGDLLFNRGTALISQLYITAIEFGISAGASSYVINNLLAFINNAILTLKPGLAILPAPSANIIGLLQSYSGLFTGTYASIVLVVWGILFILFLSLPLIQATALTVVLPVAIVTRLFAYSGPKLREASNIFIAFAIGFFFVFPLTIAFDSYITNCLTTQSASCSWLNTQYVQPITANIPVSVFFTSNTVPLSSITVSTNLFSSLSSSGAAPGSSMIFVLFTAPAIAWSYASQIADYAFAGIVLIGIDFLVTMGFIKGFATGLSSIAGLFGGERFW